jgi:hypothetical protein
MRLKSKNPPHYVAFIKANSRNVIHIILYTQYDTKDIYEVSSKLIDNYVTHYYVTGYE